jgi:hypothetical protein
MRTAITLGLLALSFPAFAQDSGDLDSSPKDSDSGSKKHARSFDEGVVREVVRGYYLKSSIGSASLNALGQGVPLSGVMSLDLGIGSDFIDKERLSAAWELQFGQALYNGPPAEVLSQYAPIVQGDIHTFSGTAVIEVSGYVSRRTGFGLRGGGGVMYVPVLVTDDAYAAMVQAWGVANADLQAGPLPLAQLGGTFEYYTKLSHFSLGADVDGQFVIATAPALGVQATGYLKYTF